MGLLVYLLCTTYYIVFPWGIVQMKFHRNKIRVIIGIAIIVLARFMDLYCGYYNKFGLLYVLGVLVGQTIGAVLLFDEPVVRTTAKYWFVFFYIDIFWLPVDSLISLICKVLEPNVNDNWVIIIKAVLLFGVILGTSYLIKKSKQIVEWIRGVPTVYFVVAILCGIAVSGISSYLEINVDDANDKAKTLMAVLVFIFKMSVYLICIGFAVTDYFRKRYKEEGVMKDQYLRMSKEHYTGLALHMQEIRRLKHDMKAHISALNKYAEEESWELLKEYLGGLTEQHSIQKLSVIHTGNELVDAIISDGVNKGYGDDITIECMGELPQDMEISDFDLCTIFSNLLSNAMEACKKLISSEKKIHIRLKNTKGEIWIVFENPVEWDVDVAALGTYTSKHDKENHGFGINNIRSTVEKYDGNMAMSAESGIFKTVIIFYK